MSLSFVPTNLDAAVNRAERLAQFITRGPGVRSLAARLRKVVERQYGANFNSQGSKFGTKWKTAAGNRVSLVDTGEFRDSFKALILVTRAEGAGRITIGFANPLVKEGMTTPFHAALADIKGIQIDVRGPVSGISRSGQPATFRAFRATVRESAKSVGYKIR